MSVLYRKWCDAPLRFCVICVSIFVFSFFNFLYFILVLVYSKPLIVLMITPCISNDNAVCAVCLLPKF